MNILDVLVQKVSEGERFKIDFKSKSLRIGNEILINNGVVIDGYEFEIPSDPLKEIENAYESYYYSTPSERSEHNKKSYFKAMSVNDMTDVQLCSGGNREVERANLEFAVLRSALSGFKWNKSYGTWYWKSKKFPELILLKEWLEA